MQAARFAPAFLALTAFFFAASATQAQVWAARPDDPAYQADRLRLERERWRTGLELRNLQAEADQRRTESVIRGLQARRTPAYVPPPDGRIYLGPVHPILVAPDPVGAALQRRQTMEQGLDGLDAWLDRARPD